MDDQQHQKDAILEHMGSCKTFVETGTALGVTTEWASGVFDQVYTIEYQENYYIGALQKFWDVPNVMCIRGDSAVLIEAVEWQLPYSTMFWLDGHYDGGSSDCIAPSGVTPILSELQFALRRNHVVLVDDARLFGQEEGYPGLREIKDMASRRGYSFENRDDILRMVPK